jgi:hypothetical protein
MRRIVMATEQTNADGTPTQTDPTQAPTWILSNRGSILPEKTYYSQVASKDGAGGQVGTGNAMPTVPLGAANGAKSGYIGDYYVYEFNSQGICSKPGATFIIGSGSKQLADVSPRVTNSSKKDFGGFVIWRNGKTSLFRSPAQMGTGVTSLTSGSPF